MNLFGGKKQDNLSFKVDISEKGISINLEEEQTSRAWLWITLAIVVVIVYIAYNGHWKTIQGWFATQHKPKAELPDAELVNHMRRAQHLEQLQRQYEEQLAQKQPKPQKIG
eukprot:CAMPEP_0202902630 /NCGR_PEP_ID=MMETSP1392-20130828/16966_1 /ASSEMBLY_ACC=CAM_ASM_000868 /TAXON_ID=225041 /ORGANISM="Chlamydomonas chlamydogama, Strain SAG 11-48b" /LENGTH=110 /DNA_ID=CAMNT_0049589423 /DNA_START=59 /DNA_END=391 /DNA_ORIENTATION=+